MGLFWQDRGKRGLCGIANVGVWAFAKIIFLAHFYVACHIHPLAVGKSKIARNETLELLCTASMPFVDSESRSFSRWNDLGGI
jgi:hypothetical protein